MDEETITATVYTRNQRGARSLNLCYYPADGKEHLTRFFSDPSKAIVFAILFNKKVRYKRGTGFEVKMRPETLRLLETVAKKHLRWQTLVKNGVIPKITEDKVRRMLAIDALVKQKH